MSIKIKDPRLTTIVSKDAIVETISDEFQFTEGPIWHPIEQHLTFSDIRASRLYRWRPGENAAVYRNESQMANGNTMDRQGRILTCEHASSRVVRECDGRLETLASHYDGRQLNSPNDIVVARDGTIWFTDPIYGRTALDGVERAPELDFRGVYRIETNGELTLLARDFEQPNGLCFDREQRALYVADSERRHIRKFSISGDGRLAGGEVFAESPAPDGLKIDSIGNVYAGGPRGVYVYDGRDGTYLGVIGTSKFCANFTWGDADLRTLYLTASTALMRVRVNIAGIPLF